jgi:hypothetical protein
VRDKDTLRIHPVDCARRRRWTQLPGNVALALVLSITMKYERSFYTTGTRGPPKYPKYPPVWVAGTDEGESQVISVQIEVTAISDAHILVKAGRVNYEVVVGGWNNTRSEIRRGQQGTTLAQVFHEKHNQPLAGPNSAVKIALEIYRTEEGGSIDVFLASNQRMLARDKKMPKISEIRVATGFNFPGEWNTQVTESEITANENSPLEPPPKVQRVSDTPSLNPSRKSETAENNDTPFSAILKRRPLRTPLSEGTRSPFPFQPKSANTQASLASVRTVLGQFE